jgi:hypothetical protein
VKRALYVLDFEREPDKEMLTLLFTLIQRTVGSEGIEVKFGKIAGTVEKSE